MKIPIYQVDAFASEVFKGNAAAVCPLETWLKDDIMQNIASENNLSETAFFVKHDAHYTLRWFTPRVEMDLCGHATLASAYIIFSRIEPGLHEVTFSTKSGLLKVTRQGDHLAMIFPARPPGPCKPTEKCMQGLGGKPRMFFRSQRDYMVVYNSEKEIGELRPCMADLAQVDAFATIVTAPGESVDFVSRFFAPGAGIPEDPVTGSSHCTLIPYWAQRLGKKKLTARQLSKRGGELVCEDLGDKVRIGGKAVCYLEGTVFLP